MISASEFSRGFEKRVGTEEAHRIGVKTGWSALDRHIRGLHDGKLYVVAGRPGSGKTSFATSMAAGILRENENIQLMYFSTELEEWEILDQITEARAGGIPIFPNGRRSTQDEVKKLTDAHWWLSEHINQYNIAVHYQKKLTVGEIVEKCTSGVLPGKKPIVIIDQASRVSRDDAHGRRNYTVATEQMLNGLEAMTQEVSLPVVLLTQANREAEGKRPTMANIKHSGAFEEFAHMVALLHTKWEEVKIKHFGGSDTSVTHEFIVAKNRHGRTGAIPSTFSGEAHTWDIGVDTGAQRF